MKTEPQNGTFTVVSLLALAALLLAYAIFVEAWVASRVPLWGDELDTIAPAFRPWRGEKDFWWQIGQYNANPPGDNLVLRLYHKSGILEWLRSSSPELFWRLPYLLVFAATAIAAFVGAWAYTGAALVGFLAFCATLVSPGLQEYANSVRFYVWLSFFVTALCWLFLCLGDGRSWKRYCAFSLVATLGVCFHLVIAAVAHFFLVYGLAWTARDALKNGVRSFKRALGLFFRIFFGALPFIIYKVELKHWIFVPHPWSKDSPWNKLLARGLSEVIATPVARTLPWQPSPHWVWIVIGLLIIVATYQAWKKKADETVRAGFLLMMLAACPVALFISGALRNYELTARHYVYESAVFICAVVYLGALAVRATRDKGILKKRIPGLHLMGSLLALALAADTLQSFSVFASTRHETSPARVTYPFIKWRAVYRHIPGPRQLVIVGSQPDELGPFSDQEEYRAGIMKFYTSEFAPLFYSVKGTYDAHGKPNIRLRELFNNEPGKHDYLILDRFDLAQKMFPRLPWKSWNCHSFTGDRPLHFCRL